jgi:GTP pyrophosphokinase
VEIVRAEQAVPPAAWESLVVTGKARSAIRRATRDAVRTQYAGLGRQILERAFTRIGKTYADETVKAVLPRLARATLDDALAAVGRGEIVSSDVVRAAFPEIEPAKPIKPTLPAEPGWFNFAKIRNLSFRVPRNGAAQAQADSAIPIRGLEGDAPVRFATGGGALPGERIVGIMTAGEGITIYPIHSPQLAKFENEPERWLDVRWDIEEERRRRFPARVSVLAINEPGVLAQIATVIAEHDGNIDNVHMTRRSADFTELTIDLEVFDLKHLTSILTQLKARPVVNKADRVTA